MGREVRKLSTKELFALGKWAEENAPQTTRLTAQEVAMAAQAALGFTVTVNNVAHIEAVAGVRLGKKNAEAKPAKASAEEVKRVSARCERLERQNIVLRNFIGELAKKLGEASFESRLREAFKAVDAE